MCYGGTPGSYDAVVDAPLVAELWTGDASARPPAPGDGESVARYPNGIDTNDASDWTLAYPSPPLIVGVMITPGYENIFIPEVWNILVLISILFLGWCVNRYLVIHKRPRKKKKVWDVH
jgi:hypothetical protein